jgi:hypothetical protein
MSTTTTLLVNVVVITIFVAVVISLMTIIVFTVSEIVKDEKDRKVPKKKEVVHSKPPWVDRTIVFNYSDTHNAEIKLSTVAKYLGVDKPGFINFEDGQLKTIIDDCKSEVLFVPK